MAAGHIIKRRRIARQVAAESAAAAAAPVAAPVVEEVVEQEPVKKAKSLSPKKQKKK